MYVLELACRDDERQAPFEKIMENPSTFIDAEYMPTGISMKDPRSMKLESLITFFKHVRNREASHGIPNAFRFKAVLSGRKKGVLGPARYKFDVGNLEEEVVTPIPKIRRKRRKPKHAEVVQDNILDQGITLPNASDKLPSTGIPSTGNPPSTGIASTGNPPSTGISNTGIPKGLHTPDPTPTPTRTKKVSPAPRNRAVKPRLLVPDNPPAEGPSSGGPRRSPRTSVQNTLPEAGIQKPKIKKKSKKR